MCSSVLYVFVFKQKTAYEWRISDWSSDVCSSDLRFHQSLALRQERTSRQQINVWIKDQDQHKDHSAGGAYPGQAQVAAEPFAHQCQIGRASCREGVCQYV